MTTIQPTVSRRPKADLAGRSAHDERYRARTRARIQQHSKPDPETGCWTWQRALDRDGYGVIQATRRDSAHRIAYLVFCGPIEQGLVIDHACHTSDTSCPGGSGCLHRRCVNPAHLELVEPSENTRRGKSPSALNAQKTHCRHGHQFTPENTAIRDDGRACRACGRNAAAAYRRRKKGMKP